MQPRPVCSSWSFAGSSQPGAPSFAGGEEEDPSLASTGKVVPRTRRAPAQAVQILVRSIHRISLSLPLCLEAKLLVPLPPLLLEVGLLLVVATAELGLLLLGGLADLLRLAGGTRGQLPATHPQERQKPPGGKQPAEPSHRGTSGSAGSPFLRTT